MDDVHRVHGEDGKGKVVWGKSSGTMTREFLPEEDQFLVAQMYHQEEKTNPKMPRLVEHDDLD